MTNNTKELERAEAADIQALNATIARIVTRQAELRTQIDATVVNLEGEQA